MEVQITYFALLIPLRRRYIEVLLKNTTYLEKLEKFSRDQDAISLKHFSSLNDNYMKVLIVTIKVKRYLKHDTGHL